MNSVESVLKLGWLPMRERRDFNLLKATHKAIDAQHWPEYAILEVHKPTKSLRSNPTLDFVRPQERGTFQDISSELFNTLPNNIKATSNYSQFCPAVKDVLKKRYSDIIQFFYLLFSIIFYFNLSFLLDMYILVARL